MIALKEQLGDTRQTNQLTRNAVNTTGNHSTHPTSYLVANEEANSWIAKSRINGVPHLYETTE